MWGSAPWERVAPTMADIHDRLIALLEPRQGECWLDVGTGTGAVAIRAARAGAAVTAQDLTPALIDTAKGLAAKEKLSITFEIGDAEQMPYPKASFDVVSSAHGVVFAPDHRRAALELARVCRPGGRLGLTAWRSGGAGDEFDRLVSRFEPPKPPGLLPGAGARKAMPKTCSETGSSSSSFPRYGYKRASRGRRSGSY
jgi:ubiquinone/menaquinone biosynthesis C-methylase UbiE